MLCSLILSTFQMKALRPSVEYRNTSKYLSDYKVTHFMRPWSSQTPPRTSNFLVLLINKFCICSLISFTKTCKGMQKVKHLTWPSRNTLVFSLCKRKLLTRNTFLFPIESLLTTTEHICMCHRLSLNAVTFIFLKNKSYLGQLTELQYTHSAAEMLHLTGPILNLQKVCSSKTPSKIYQCTGRYPPNDGNLNSKCNSRSQLAPLLKKK